MGLAKAVVSENSEEHSKHTPLGIVRVGRRRMWLHQAKNTNKGQDHQSNKQHPLVLHGAFMIRTQVGWEPMPRICGGIDREKHNDSAKAPATTSGHIPQHAAFRNMDHTQQQAFSMTGRTGLLRGTNPSNRCFFSLEVEVQYPILHFVRMQSGVKIKLLQAKALNKITALESQEPNDKPNIQKPGPSTPCSFKAIRLPKTPNERSPKASPRLRIQEISCRHVCCMATQGSSVKRGSRIRCSKFNPCPVWSISHLGGTEKGAYRYHLQIIPIRYTMVYV